MAVQLLVFLVMYRHGLNRLDIHTRKGDQSSFESDDELLSLKELRLTITKGSW